MYCINCKSECRSRIYDNSINKMDTEFIDIKLDSIGGGAFNHRLLCWHCKISPAVYSANPDWCFLPCWSCQKIYDGIWNKKGFWKKLLGKKK